MERFIHALRKEDHMQEIAAHNDTVHVLIKQSFFDNINDHFLGMLFKYITESKIKDIK